jgi:hypothetical protein
MNDETVCSSMVILIFLSTKLNPRSCSGSILLLHFKVKLFRSQN